MSKASDAARAEALETLRPHLAPGATVYTRVLSVSRTGMSRTISAHLILTDADTGQPYPWDISGLVARATGNPWANDGGVRMGGVGMDMTFALVYSLSRAMFPQGYRCTGSDGRTPSGKRSKTPRCPSNDHSNDYGRLSREYDDAHVAQWRDRMAEVPNDDAAQQVIRTEYVAARQEWIGAQRTYTKTRTHRDGGYALNRGSL